MSSTASSSFTRRNVLAAADRWRLPFSRQAWRGLAGNWIGAGVGSSIDFQDHRSYAPGDDPRHIHWQAYARTGALTMKLYRAEIAPVVDVILDVSASMWITPAKADRASELLAFAVECAVRAGAPVRVNLANGRTVRAVSSESVRADRWRERIPAETCSAIAPGPLPWRTGALKVLISDLLFPGDPAELLGPLASGAGLGVILAPASEEESELPWRGNVELTDCESGAVRKQRIDETLAGSYRESYRRHFRLWREACRRRGVLVGRVACEGALINALAGETFAAGAVEAVT